MRISAFRKRLMHQKAGSYLLKERDILRRAYIDSFKESLVGQLENTYIVDDKGNKKKVQRKNK